MPSHIQAKSGEWSVDAIWDDRPDVPHRWSLAIHRFGSHAGSAFWTPEAGFSSVFIRRSGKRDCEPFPAADLGDQLRKSLPPIALA